MQRRSLTAVLAATVLLSPASASGQGILNTERFQLDDVAGFHTSFDLSIAGAAGNTRFVDAAASGIVGYRAERHWTRVIAGGRFLADRERRVLDDRFVQLRYSYGFSPGLEAFQFVQYQANRSLLLERRVLVGGGIRVTAARGQRTTLRIGTGLMYEDERRDRDRLDPDDEPRLRVVRVASHAVLAHRLAGGARLLDILYVQPSATSLTDLRLLNDLGLDVPLAEHVSLSVALEWRHDSRPPGSLKSDDLGFRTGISVDLR